MKWKKTGLTTPMTGACLGRGNSALQATPIELPTGQIRGYPGFRHDDGVSSVVYVSGGAQFGSDFRDLIPTGARYLASSVWTDR